MAIEIWNGSAWVVSSDPEIFQGGAWTNVQKGEIYTGSSWSTFYNRVTPIAPTLSLNSRTSTSITINVSVPTGTPYKTQVTVWRTGNLPGSLIPASPAVGAISGTFTQTGLTVNTSYTFNAYTTYYDAVTNEQVAQSETMTYVASTLAVTIQAPTITLNSRTVSSITVNVSLATGSPYKTQVTVYRVGNELNAQNIPAFAAVGAISGTFSQSGLSVNTSYTFSAYANYYDAGTNELVATSSTTSASFSTLNYSITTPTTPTNSTRTSTTLDFSSSSSANYSTNASTAYIEFRLEAQDLFGSWYFVTSLNSSNLPNDDTTVSRTVTFTSLAQGTLHRCRASTVYSTIGQQSGYSAYSAQVSTRTLVDTPTGYISSNNTTHLLTGFCLASTALSTDPASKGSNNNFSDAWISNAGAVTSESRVASNVERDAATLTAYAQTTFSFASASEGALANVTNLRYSVQRVWTYNTGFGRFTDVYYTQDIPYTTNNQVVLSGFTGLGIDGTRTIVATTTFGGYYIRTFAIAGATLTGTQSNPTLAPSSYTQGGAVGVNKTRQATTGFGLALGQLQNLSFSDTGGVVPLAAVIGASPTLTAYASEGNELLYVYFSPNSSYTDVKMLANIDAVRVKNGGQARTISATINNVSLGSLSFAADQIRDFVVPQTVTPWSDPSYGGNYFSVYLTVPRRYTAFGYYASIYEVQIQFNRDVET